MNPIEIVYQLRLLGKNQAQIARELGVSGGLVSNVIHGRATAHSVAVYIASLLGREISDIWPHQYTFKPRGAHHNRRDAQTIVLDSEGEAT